MLSIFPASLPLNEFILDAEMETEKGIGLVKETETDMVIGRETETGTETKEMGDVKGMMI